MKVKLFKFVHIFSDGSFSFTRKCSLITNNKFDFLSNSFQDSVLLKKNIKKVQKQEGLKFHYRKKNFKL